MNWKETRNTTRVILKVPCFSVLNCLASAQGEILVLCLGETGCWVCIGTTGVWVGLGVSLVWGESPAVFFFGLAEGGGPFLHMGSSTLIS